AVIDLGCHLIAGPVFDQERKVIGYLVLANSLNASPFAVTDEKLVRLMARKASRIIQPNYDSLTGAITRNGFEYYLETALYMARYNRSSHCVFYIDIDKLHVINETASHHAGDEALRLIARAIRSTVDVSGVVARLSGDEFGVLLTDCDVTEGQRVADSLLRAINEIPFYWDKSQHELSASIGVAAMTTDTKDIVAVLSAAEVACIAAKEAGRNRVQVYAIDNTAVMHRQAQIQWVGQLNSALKEDSFELFGQRYESLGNDTNERQHVEILLRLYDENNQLLTPDEFLPSAERFHLMPVVDRWVLRNTLKRIASSLPQSVRDRFVWSINLSGQSLTDVDFYRFVCKEVEQMGIDPATICFEITETAAITDKDQAIEFMAGLRNHGFLFALDDFGTGLSSFAYLQQMPVDYLKIDGTFIERVAADVVTHSMVGAIQEIADRMGLLTIAEFVNEPATREVLSDIGVDYAQGFSVHAPERLHELLQRLSLPEINDNVVSLIA
ncbi:MAG: EAL domain-containing protein, partial [Gammaproteobacteria bacterium]|nr:EAL domain-containing protein [Gammaproteobacteria bacterium]